MTPSYRGFFIAYLILQALGAAAWWIGIFASPPFREWFLAPGAPDQTLIAFLAADAVLFIGASLASAALLFRRHRAATPVLWLTAGAISYGALYTLGLSFLTGAAWPGSIPMTVAMFMTLTIAWRSR